MSRQKKEGIEGIVRCEERRDRKWNPVAISSSRPDASRCRPDVVPMRRDVVPSRFPCFVFVLDLPSSVEPFQ